MDWYDRPGPQTSDGRDFAEALEPIYAAFVTRQRRLERLRQRLWVANHQRPGWLETMQPVCRVWWQKCDEANCKLYDLQRLKKQAEMRPEPYSETLDRHLRKEVLRLQAEVDGLTVEVRELEKQINGAGQRT